MQLVSFVNVATFQRLLHANAMQRGMKTLKLACTVERHFKLQIKLGMCVCSGGGGRVYEHLSKANFTLCQAAFFLPA